MTEEREQYGDYSVDDEDQPGAEDTLDDSQVDDPLDTGYSPVEGYRTDYGNTPWEEEHRETIDQRIGQEVPEPDPYAEEPDDEDAVQDPSGSTEVGDQRAGRLVEPDEGVRDDTEKDLVADDVGIDGAGASAEEAAVHVIDEEQ